MLVTGSGGMVGRAVRELCEQSGDTVFAYDRAALDIANAEQVSEMVRRSEPDAVINCAAWTDVDGCETDVERAYAVNARGPENLAIASRDANAAFVTISTDYVFDGAKEGFYTEEDQPNPQSAYGRAKLEGERRSQKANPQSVIVRTGFIFGRGGKNFLSTVIDRARRGEQIKAITDAYGTPTYSRDLARRLRELAQLNHPGIFHVANAGNGVSYAEFAREAIKCANLGEPQVEEVLTESLNRPAPRPQNSRLRSVYFAALGLAPLPDWRDSLCKFAAETRDPSTDYADSI
ncbi:MAG TPA: dTDP-4-dehydrorhamnose reductase [Pyrinomonadaceae bacterium]|nr:dTDP-4-dehydrorhamnose reductase [Pyrinomonadaceae bacterium]